jgi:hypothetical protein
MRNPLKRPATALSAIAALSFALAACETEPQEFPAGDIEDESEVTDITAPGVVVTESGNDDYSAETAQPTIGADAVSGELGSGAEPTNEIPDEAPSAANRATE